MLLETHAIWSFEKEFLILGIQDTLKCNHKASGRLKVHDWTYGFMNFKQWLKGNIDSLSQNCTSSALDQRHWQCATQTPVTECPYFWSWDFEIACMLLKEPVFEASLRTHAPAAASKTCLWAPRLGTALVGHVCLKKGWPSGGDDQFIMVH